MLPCLLSVDKWGFCKSGLTIKTRKGITPAIRLSQLDFDAYEIKSAWVTICKIDWLFLHLLAIYKYSTKTSYIVVVYLYCTRIVVELKFIDIQTLTHSKFLSFSIDKLLLELTKFFCVASLYYFAWLLLQSRVLYFTQNFEFVLSTSTTK